MTHIAADLQVYVGENGSADRTGGRSLTSLVGPGGDGGTAQNIPSNDGFPGGGGGSASLIVASDGNVEVVGGPSRPACPS